MTHEPSTLTRVEHPAGLVTYQSPRLNRLGVPHAFTTRLGGVSQDPYRSLNLGSLAKGPDTDLNMHVAENFRRLRAALELERCPRVEVRQVHAGDVFESPPKPINARHTPCADAVVTPHRQQALVIRTADCVPVLLADAHGQAVAAVHAGWRGIVAGVIPNTVDRLAQLGAPANRLVAAVGPCISLEHFEVGPEVAEAFEGVNLAETVDRSGARPHIDLRQAAAMQLERAGLPSDAIEISDRCTFRDGEEFFSHRRDGSPGGRMAAIIALP